MLQRGLSRYENFGRVTQKKSQISVLREKKTRPIMLKTGASANAPVFLCPKCTDVCQRRYYALC
ncbi:hypothetical protein CBG35_05615 [Vibrio cholerae O139]|nr:hypothetical protein CBG35_05615 [Vibrio cholerae O139]PWG92074.1 hypothetical protein DIJ59_11975 [Vibrio cholerae]